MPDISVYDEIAVTESLDFGGELGYRQISVNDSISVSDILTIQPELSFRTDLREGRNPKAPVHAIEAEFASAFSASTYGSKTPVRSIQAYAGSELDKTTPTHSIEATLTPDSYFFSLDSKIPTAEVIAETGWSLDEKAPTRSIDSEFIQELALQLLKRMPGWRITATMEGAYSFSLDKDMPVWYGDLSLVTSEEAPLRLNEKIPFPRLSSTAYEQGSFTLDRSLPFWKIESAAYSGAFELDKSMPAWIIESLSDAVMAEDNRFSDYILRYVRP